MVNSRWGEFVLRLHRLHDFKKRHRLQQGADGSPVVLPVGGRCIGVYTPDRMAQTASIPISGREKSEP